ncbi:MAG: cytochrome c-type biogenesis protein CcmH [Gammaproteobacteria bacterium]|nr:cytochrome c-type biogenesis protein CcmH [Gammaproteobacteria bacterium]
MRPLLFVLLIGCLIAPVRAAIEAYEFDSPQMEADYNQLVDELRCLVCQNQNLAGSDADLAQDLRRETYEMLRQGKSPQQVVDFMVARYGDFVLYRPQFKSSTYLLWLGPFLLLVVVLVIVVRRLRTAAKPVDVDEDALASARQLLEEDAPESEENEPGEDTGTDKEGSDK